MQPGTDPAGRAIRPSLIAAWVAWTESRSVIRPGEAPRLWLIALLLALAGHMAGLTWLSPRPPPGRPPHRPPMRFSMALPSDQRGPAVPPAVDVWSPAWFAFPSEHGFSRALLRQRSGLRPPLALPFRSGLALSRPPAPPAPALQPFSAANRAGQHEIPTVAPPRRVFAGAGREPPRGIQVKFLGGLEGRPPPDFSWPEKLRNNSPGAWQAEAHLQVEPGGWVSSVFLVSATVSNSVRDALLRAIYGWTFPPDGDRGAGIAILRGGKGEA
jgi:hypothetical protein